MRETPVLIVGAGPTGLVLAMSLALRKVRFRLISEADGPGEHSRAMAVQARTLEFYDQFGFAQEVVAQGIPGGAAHLLEALGNGRTRPVTSFNFRDLGEGLSPFPFVLAYPQDDHERFLIGKLKAAGVEVEWGCRLTGFRQDENGVVAEIARDGHTGETWAGYICGCDGAHSRVRETLGIGFPGGTYDQLFYVADVSTAEGFTRDLFFGLGESILTLMLPVRSSGMQRLIGLVPPELSDREDLTFEEIRDRVEPLLGIRVSRVNWFSTYRVHHRVAEHFRAGRAFLLGDAAHIHSPAGGQGMNTGIGDAVNLGWKLAHVIQGRAGSSLLDSYEPERIGFARTLVSTTDRAFTSMVAGGLRGRLTRRVIAPLFLAVGTRFAPTRRAIFRVLSQIRIHYPQSPLSEGKAGTVHGGDRLPWVRVGAEDNFAPLRSLDWQVHVYGRIDEVLEDVCREIGIAVHVFPWSDAARQAGLARDAMYLVRPDGHVALASPRQSEQDLRMFAERFLRRA